MLFFFSSASFLLGGCSSTAILGTVDGQRIDVVEASFERLPDVLGEDDLTVVTLSTFEGGCVSEAFFEEVQQLTTDPEELAREWSEAFPEQFWSVKLYVRSTEPVASKATLAGLAWDELLSDPDTAYASLTRYDKHRDEAYFAGEASPLEYSAEYLSDGGELTVKKSEPDTRLKGVFGMDVVTREGGAAGDLKVKFDAAPCQ